MMCLIKNKRSRSSVRLSNTDPGGSYPVNSWHSSNSLYVPPSCQT